VDVFLIGIRLQFVGHGEHDQVGPSGGCCDVLLGQLRFAALLVELE
jgi:uncharacterized membrane protein YGL010W